MLSSAEVFDPASGKWTPTQPMAFGRYVASATLLDDGRVLIVGGSDNSGFVKPTETFNPMSSSWTTVGSLSTGRRQFPLAALRDGSLLAAGGWPTTNTAEVLDRASTAWHSISNLNQARSNHTATTLKSGKVLVAGGADTSSPIGSAELFDPKRGIWNVTASLPQARSNHTATLLSDATVLVAGGNSSDAAPYVLGTTATYDEGPDSWSAGPTMTTPRANHTATLLADGRVLVVGGNSVSSERTGTAELYTPARSH
jgi:N-acetylneuraminic acid mutarotase